jgi:hypothetical protein
MKGKRASAPPSRAHPAYLEAFTRVMSGIERALGPRRPPKPVDACVAGGAALHFYTGERISNDVDAKIMARVLLDPDGLQVAYQDPDGHARILYFDTQYNDTFGLLHEDAYRDAVPIELDGIDPRRLCVKLLAPVDLAISKLARFNDQDREDIRSLGRAGLVDARALRRRASEAMAGYVGDPGRVKGSIDIAAADLKELAAARTASRKA